MNVSSFYDIVRNTDFSLNIVTFLQENVGLLLSVSCFSYFVDYLYTKMLKYYLEINPFYNGQHYLMVEDFILIDITLQAFLEILELLENLE